MAKQTKKPRLFTLTQKAEILGELGSKRGSLAAAARKHNVGEGTLHAWKKAHPEWVGKPRVVEPTRAAPAAPPIVGIAETVANGTNGHPKSEPPPASTARLEITGLRGFVRENVRAELRAIVREEIASMMGRIAAP